MIGGVSGVDSQHLREMASAFRGGRPHADEDATPDGAHHVANDGSCVTYDGRAVASSVDAMNATDRTGSLPLSGAVGADPHLPRVATVSGDGKFVLFTVRCHDTTRILQMERAGLLFKHFTAPEVCFDLDGEIAAIDVSPLDSSLAIAHGNQVAECSPQGGNRLAAQVPEPLADVKYLSDGSLALCSQRGPDGYHFYLVPPGSSQTIPVSLQEMDPAALRQQQRDDLAWAKLTDGDVDAFQQKNPWLFNPNGSVVPYAWLESPKAGDGRLLVLVPGSVVQARVYDVATRDSRPVGQLEGIPLESLSVAWESDSPMLAAWDQKSPTTSLHVWDSQSGAETVLPEVSGVSYDKGTAEICFTPPNDDGSGHGAPVRCRLDAAAALKTQTWCQKAEERYVQRLQTQLLPGAAKTATAEEEARRKAAGAVEVDGAFVNVSGVRVPRRA